jgi:hypothetical protein
MKIEGVKKKEIVDKKISTVQMRCGPAPSSKCGPPRSSNQRREKRTSNLLRLLRVATSDSLGVLGDVGVRQGVLVSALDERVSLSIEGSLRTGLGRVDEGDDLEPRAELVLESEGVVPGPLVYGFEASEGAKDKEQKDGKKARRTRKACLAER